MVTKLVYGGIAAAGAIGGFVLDRSIANTPYRQDKRLPDIAREKAEADYYDYDRPNLPGGGVNAAVLCGPIVGAVLGVGGVIAAQALVKHDRIWQHTLVGRAAIGGAIIGASMATGAIVSRAVLG
jgi:hypothetical protein